MRGKLDASRQVISARRGMWRKQVIVMAAARGIKIKSEIEATDGSRILRIIEKYPASWSWCRYRPGTCFDRVDTTKFKSQGSPTVTGTSTR